MRVLKIWLFIYYANKWYMHKLESLLENKMHKIPWDFDKQTDNEIPAWRPHLVLINKKEELVIWWILLSQLTTEWK